MLRKLLPTAGLLALALAFAPQVSAQVVGGILDTQYKINGTAPGEFLGASVDGAGDVNNDGTPDYIIGSPFASPGGAVSAGVATVYSGLDGSILYTFNGTAAGDNLGVDVAGLGDLNADGFDEVGAAASGYDLFGKPNTGAVFVYSGFDGSILYTFTGAGPGDGTNQVSSAGDVDADLGATPDIIVGAQSADPGGLTDAGSATIYSGFDGSVLYNLPGSAAGDAFGIVGAAGDANNDGNDDVIVGAPLADPGGLADAGRVVVISGFDGSVLLQRPGLAAGDQFGSSVAPAGDPNGDGNDDVIAGAPLADPGGLVDAGRVSVINVALGTNIYQFAGAAADNRLGFSVANAGDLLGDGFQDYVVGVLRADPGGKNNAGSAACYSGRTGAPLFTLEGTNPNQRMGYSVGGVGDIDGDGAANMITGAPFASPGGAASAGKAWVFGFNGVISPRNVSISAAAGGNLVYTLDFGDDDGLANFALLASATGTGPTVTGGGVAIPLTSDGLFNDMVNGNPPSVFNNPYGTLDPNGNATSSLTFAPGLLNNFIGSTFYVAGVSYSGSTVFNSSVVSNITVVP